MVGMPVEITKNRTTMKRTFVQADLTLHWSQAHHWTAAFELHQGEVLAIYGASGVGKTTLLRVLAGLEQPQGGTLQVGGDCWYDGAMKKALKPQQRRIGMVFQDYALFPHWTVRQHLNYVTQDKALVEELLEAVALQTVQHQRPAQLSGGQQQRLALIRALARAPQLLLLDEPFAALDPPLRQAAQTLLRQLHQRFQGATILVSHDPPEIMALADRLLVLEWDQALWYDTPATYFENQGLWQAWQLQGQVVQITATMVWVETTDGTSSFVRGPQWAAVQVGDWVQLRGGQHLLGVAHWSK